MSFYFIKQSMLLVLTMFHFSSHFLLLLLQGSYHYDVKVLYDFPLEELLRKILELLYRYIIQTTIPHYNVSVSPFRHSLFITINFQRLLHFFFSIYYIVASLIKRRKTMYTAQFYGFFMQFTLIRGNDRLACIFQHQGRKVL